MFTTETLFEKLKNAAPAEEKAEDARFFKVLSLVEKGDFPGAMEVLVELAKRKLIASIEDGEIDEKLWKSYTKGVEAIQE